MSKTAPKTPSKPASKPAAKHRLSLKKVLPAAPQEVWLAWTEPAKIDAWFQPDPQLTAKAVSFEAKTGGTYRIEMTGAEALALTGQVREAKAPVSLVYTWAAVGANDPGGDTAPASCSVSLRLTASGSGTELSLEQGDFADLKTLEQHSAAWSACLQRLEDLLSGKAPAPRKAAKAPGSPAARGKAARRS